MWFNRSLRLVRSSYWKPGMLTQRAAFLASSVTKSRSTSRSLVWSTSNSSLHVLLSVRNSSPTSKKSLSKRCQPPATSSACPRTFANRMQKRSLVTKTSSPLFKNRRRPSPNSSELIKDHDPQRALLVSKVNKERLYLLLISLLLPQKASSLPH